MNRLGLRFTPAEIRDDDLENTAVAVIDVLRATTVLSRAVAEGASRIHPVAAVEAALEFPRSPATLLCGEQNGFKIPGFDLGNSPLEYSRDVVFGRELIFCTTNGSRALVRCRSASLVVAAAFVNAGAAAERLRAARKDVLIVCAGSEERPCVEDTAMGGLLVQNLLRVEPEFLADDAALLARTVWTAWEGRIDALLSECRHGLALKALGFEEDLAYCGRLDALDVVPTLRGGVIDGSSQGAERKRDTD